MKASRAVAAVVLIGLVCASALSADDEAARMEQQKRELMQRIDQEVGKFKASCVQNPDGCDCGLVISQKPQCGQAPDADGVSACESAVESGYQQCVSSLNEGWARAQQERERIESACRESWEACDCSGIAAKKYRDECEAAKAQAEREWRAVRERMMAQCNSDPSTCDCASIPTTWGRQECEAVYAKRFAEAREFQQRCKQDPVSCDCSVVEPSSMREQCEASRANALRRIDFQIRDMVGKCFADIRSCECEKIPENFQSVRDYCIQQRTFAVNCLDYGLDCDRLDADSFMDESVPELLRPILSQSLQTYMKSLRGAALNKAYDTIQACVTAPETCDCSAISKDAVAFCETKKELGVRCRSFDYEACMQLDAGPKIPPNIPQFAVGPLESVVDQFVALQKAAVYTAVAPIVSDTVVKCVDDPVSGCDCSIAPEGEFRNFCEYKKSRAQACVVSHDYKACYEVVNTPALPEGTPEPIRFFFMQNQGVRERIQQKVKAYYEGIRPAECASLSMDECFARLGYNEVPQHARVWASHYWTLNPDGTINRVGVCQGPTCVTR